MSLRRIKTLYCLAVIAIGVLLAALGGWVGWLAAVLVLSGALPGWIMGVRAIRLNTITVFEYRAQTRARSEAPLSTSSLENDRPDNLPEVLKEPRSIHRA